MDVPRHGVFNPYHSDANWNLPSRYHIYVRKAYQGDFGFEPGYHVRHVSKCMDTNERARKLDSHLKATGKRQKSKEATDFMEPEPVHRLDYLPQMTGTLIAMAFILLAPIGFYMAQENGLLESLVKKAMDASVTSDEFLQLVRRVELFTSNDPHIKSYIFW